MNVRVDSEKLAKLFLHPKGQEMIREVEQQEDDQCRRPQAAKELRELLKERGHYPRNAELELVKKRFDDAVAAVEPLRQDWNRKFSEKHNYLSAQENRIRELHTFLHRTAPQHLKDALANAEDEVRHLRRNPRKGDGDGRNSKLLEEVHQRLADIKRKMLEGE